MEPGVTASAHLAKKSVTLMITNACVRVCGGCSMLCGTFVKDELFYISLPEFRRCVEIIRLHQRRSHPDRGYDEVMLYGGEPTAHPEFQGILDICAEYQRPNDWVAFPLWSCSSARVDKFNVPGNVIRCITEKSAPGWEQDFVAGLASPHDILHAPNKGYYWEVAQRSCIVWNSCGKQIYNGRAYLCDRAGPFEQHMGTDHGWPVEDGKDPWDRTDDEIAEQARHFCYRCGHCLSGCLQQKTSAPYVVTPTNGDLLRRPSFKQRLDVIQEGAVDQASLDRTANYMGYMGQLPERTMKPF